MYQWKKFQFFEKHLVKEGSEENQAVLKKLEIQCASAGRGYLLFGDIEGGLHVLDRDFTIIRSFQAYARFIIDVQQVKLKNIVVTIGNDEETLVPTVKMWNFDRFDFDGFPELVRAIRLPESVMATSLAITPDLSHLAVGLVDGRLITVGGDPLYERLSTEHATVLDADSPVTGLHFSMDGQKTYLFAATSNLVSSFLATREGLILVEALDDKGCETGCSALTGDGDLVMGRNEAVYFYATSGRGPARAFEGERKLIGWFRNYLLVVDASSANHKYNTLTIYDDKNRFVAYSGSFESITALVAEWNIVFVVTRGGNIYRLIEKDTQTKLETLFRKNLYQVAIEMAQSNHYDPAAIVDIYREYGDHLYDKGDYDGAIKQYIMTIGAKGQYGMLEPSYVIKQFLDAQRIHNLTFYLEKLHEAGVANANHTTLLLNCYTKLKDVEKLNKFIKTPDLNFDVETAIKVCRQAGYHENALELAREHHVHHWYIKILLEDLGRDQEALTYIERLSFKEAEGEMKRYGKSLIQTLPQETTTLLKKLCTNYTPSDGSSNVLSSSAKRSSPEEFIHIFVGQTDWLINFLEFIIDKRRATGLIYNTLLELYLREDEDESEELRALHRQKAFSILATPDASYDDAHALVLCQMHKFKMGILFLFEKMHLYNDVLQYYMDNNEYDNVLKFAKKHAGNDANLWIKTLSYFVNKENASKLKQEIVEILRHIEQRSTVPPWQIVQILSQSKAADLGLAKEFISRFILKEQSLIAEKTKEMNLLRTETNNNVDELRQLKGGVFWAIKTVRAKVFQAAKCTRCESGLDLPAIHFLCNHSFHLRCLGENESVCPECAQENADFKNRLRQLEENARKHSEFFRMMEGSRDGFGLVAEYFGRGLFSRGQHVETAAALDAQLPTLDLDLFKDLNIK